MNTHIIQDTTAPFLHFAKNGYYTVNDKIFNHNIYAFQEATKTNSEVKWHFNEDVLSNLDWQTPPTLSLLEAYRLRAQQLRQQYDYLILCWSGGADSTTILESFLNNNIRLDEVVILWSTKQTDGKYVPNSSTEATNFLSEWDLTIKPLIQLYKTNHPKLKITILDHLSDSYKNTVEYADDTVRIARHNYITVKKYRALDNHMKKKFELHSKVGAIVGMAPVDTAILNDKYFVAYFTDGSLTGTSKSDYTLDGFVRNIEFFYSTPDLPELIKTQAHAMFRYCQNHPETRNLWHHLKLVSTTNLQYIKCDGELHRQLRKKILYPNWNNELFQVKKEGGSLIDVPWNRWWINNPHALPFLDPWKSAVESEIRLVDKRFCVYDGAGLFNYQSFYSKYYYIGELYEDNTF